MNVGDYIRTREYIRKIRKIEQDYIYCDIGVFIENEIIKTSPQIIDLIEVGDYVNDLRVEKNKYGDLYISYVYYGGDIGKQCEVYTNWIKEMQEEDIYTVLTHEQMEAMQYRVEE